jgi:hypothetical protein
LKSVEALGADVTIPLVEDETALARVCAFGLSAAS